MPKLSAHPLTLQLVALRAGSLADVEGALPTRLVVCPWGESDAGERGKVIVNDTTAATFTANQLKIRRDGKVALDFEHNTVEGTEAYKSSAEPRPVAAWAFCSVVPGEGIVFDRIDWTDEGQRMITGGHFRDLSPAVFRRSDGVVVALHSAAVCRHGELANLSLFSAAALSAFSAVLTPDSTPMTPELRTALAALLKKLGVDLAADADDAALLAALDSAAGAVKTETEVEAPAAMSARVTKLEANLVALTAERDSIKKDALIQAATLAGKVIPLSADDIKLVPLAALESMIQLLPAGTVPTQQRTTPERPDATKVEAFTAADRTIAAAMGLTDDDLAKFGPKSLASQTA